MILAAGKGTRLLPWTERTPKPLLEVGGKPILAHVLEIVRRSGVREVVINLHHLGEQIRAYVGDGSRFGLSVSYSIEDHLLDTGGAIANARKFLFGEPFLVVNADVIFDGDLSFLVAAHESHNALVTLMVRADPTGVRHDDVRVDERGRVWSLLGLGPRRELWESLPRYFYASAMVCAPTLLDHLLPGVYSLTRHVLPRLLAEQEPVYAAQHRGYWRALDTPGELEAGRRDLAGGRDLTGGWDLAGGTEGSGSS